MAQDVQTKILELEIRYQPAIAALGKYRSEIEATRNLMSQLKGTHKEGSMSTTEYQRSMSACEQSIKTANGSIAVLSKQIQNQVKVEKENEGSLTQLRAKLSQATKAYDDMSRKERESAKGQELKDKIKNITSELKGAEEETDRFYRNVGNYKEAVAGLGKVEEKAKGIGQALLAAAGITSLGALGKKAEEVGTAYADQMAKVRAVTNANAVEFAQMSTEVERLGSTTRYTALEAGEAMEFLTRNGLSAVNATGALEGVLHLAQANAIELAEAADIVTGQMNAFHLSVGDVAHINDVLSYTCSHSATDILMLNEALRNTAPIAYTSGVSIEETCAALATLADNNIKGADSGTILKQTFNGLITSTAKSKKAYDALGIQMDISTVKSDGFINSLQRIMDAGPSVQQLSDIFGRRAVPGVLALTNSMDLLNEKFQNITENAAGTADRMFEQSYSKFTIAAKSMESAWEGLLISVWQGNNDELRNKYVSEGEKVDKAYVPVIENLKKKVKELNAEFAKDPTNDFLGKELLQYTQELRTAAGEYTKAKDDLSSQMEAEMAKSGDAGMAGMMQGPIEAIGDAIRWIRANLQELGTMIMALIGGISLTALVNHVKSSAAASKAALITNAQAATQQVNNLANKEAMQRREVERLKTQYENTSASERQLIANKLTIKKSQLAETEKALTKAKTNEIKLMEQAAASTTATGWKAAMQSASMAVKGFVNASKTAMKSFALTAILSLAIELIMKLWSAFNSGKGPIGSIGKQIGSFVKNALQVLGKVICDVINWFIDFYNDSKFVRFEIAALGGTFKAVWTLIKGGIASVGNAFKLLGGIIKGVADALAGLFTLDFDRALNGIKQLGSAVTEFYKNQKDVAIEAAGDIVEGYKSSFEDIDKKIERVQFKSTNVDNPKGDGATDGTSSVTSSSTTDSELVGDVSSESEKGKGGDKSDKAAKEAQRRAKLESEALANLQNELYKILEDGAEKRRQATEAEYNKRIDKLRTQLDTERNLTATARYAIAKTIEVIEKEKADALVKLAKEEQKKVLEEEIKNNEARLNLIANFTGRALNETLKGLREERNAAIQKANEEIADEQERQAKISEINASFDAQRLTLIKAAADTELGIRLANLDMKHDIAVQEMQDAINIEKRKVEALMSISKEQYDAMSDEEKASYDRQMSEAVGALQRKNEELTLINEQYAHDTTEAQEANDEKVRANQKQYLADRIQSLQNDEDERLLMLQSGQAKTEEELQADQQRKLESIGGFQAHKLEMQAEAAQAEYDALVERGQLSTQTEEEYNRELETSRQNNLQAKKNIDDAYVKQEQAKYSAMKGVTSALTGLLDTLGESNKAFAQMSKIITLAQIAIDTGKAISAGVASAMREPFPANIAAVATTVATVIANITTAISTVKSAKFAEGGKVNGPGSDKSDSVPAMLSNGEFVMTAAATRIYEPLLVAMNGIGRGVPMQVVNANRDAMLSESLTESFTAAAQDIKPVVSVVEISDMQNRVRTIENLDNF